MSRPARAFCVVVLFCLPACAFCSIQIQLSFRPQANPRAGWRGSWKLAEAHCAPLRVLPVLVCPLSRRIHIMLVRYNTGQRRFYFSRPSCRRSRVLGAVAIAIDRSPIRGTWTKARGFNVGYTDPAAGEATPDPWQRGRWPARSVPTAVSRAGGRRDGARGNVRVGQA